VTISESEPAYVVVEQSDAPVGTFFSLRYPGSKRYFAGLILSMVGTWMQSVGLTWVITNELQIAKNQQGRALGAMLFFSFVPLLVLGAWVGSLSDRMDKRRLMLITQVAMGSAAFVLAVLTLTKHITLPIVLVLAFVGGVATAFDTPVRRALIGDLVPPIAISNAMSLNTSVMTSSRVIGVSIGGFVIRYFGTGWCFLLNAISYLFMIIALTGLRSREHATIAKASDGGVRGGILHVWRTPVLRLTMLSTLIIATFLFNYSLTYPLIVKNVFHREADTLGWMLAISGLGSFVGAIIAARMRRPSLNVFLGSCVGMGVSGLLVGLSKTLTNAFFAAFPLGLFGGLLMAMLSGLLTTYSPQTMRGRVLALQSVVFLGSTPIGGPIVGSVADRFGPRWGMLLGAYATIGTAVLAIAFRSSSRQPRMSTQR
jgi:MFS family permease